MGISKTKLLSPEACPTSYLYCKGHVGPLSLSPPSPAQVSVHVFMFAERVGRGSSQF